MITQRIEAFQELGRRLANLAPEEFERWARNAKNENGWFDEESVKNALEGVCFYLSQLEPWLQRYSLNEPASPKKIGLVMAGNIPLVGFHDVLCILLLGHAAHTKLSSQDSFLNKEIARMLFDIDPELRERWVFAERMNDVDALIATGSDNTAKHFEYYFRHKPHIIRRNRHSIGILSGQESAEELQALAQDVLAYYGLGCRNVSKLYVPYEYDFIPFLKQAEVFAQKAVLNNKYSNNYDYNKSIYLVNQVPHLDNGGLIVTENEGLGSPVSVVYYERYASGKGLKVFIDRQADRMQCLVSKEGSFPGSLPFGQTQRPCAWDYADGVDTVAFLAGL